MPPNGKTLSLLSHFPDFYATGEATVLHALAATLGDALEGVETDLIRVLRSHFVDTASNRIAHSPTQTQRGDLDQLFALYLERLGGTSQIVRVSNQFQPKDLLKLETLVTEIVRPTTALGQDLHNLGCNQSPKPLPPLTRYTVDLARRQDQVHFTAQSWTQPANLLTRLLIGRDPLLQYLQSRLSATTQAGLNRYTGTDKVPTDLLESFTDDINRLLPERALTQAIQARYDYWTLGKALREAGSKAENRLTQTPAILFATDAPPQAQARYLRKKLPLPVQKQIFWRQMEEGFTAADLPELVTQLQPHLSEGLPQASIWQPLLEVSQGRATIAPAPDNMRLSLVVVTALLQAATQAILRHLVSIDSQFPSLNTDLLARLVSESPETPRDRIRHNRLCLEASYPAEISPSGIPTEAAARETLAAFLNQVVLPDPKLYARNQNFFTPPILDPETQDLIQASETHPPLDTRLQQRLNRLLLEAAFPTALQKSYVTYRERMLGLIQVLQQGASTPDGIRDIVAANLGIFEDHPAGQDAKQKIEIEEFWPKLVEQTVTVHPWATAFGEVPNATAADTILTLAQTFTLHNPNVVATIPSFSFELVNLRSHLPKLTNFRLVQIEHSQPTQTALCYSGQLGLSTDQAGNQKSDVLQVLDDGTLLWNGYSSNQSLQPPPALPLGDSQWCIQADLGDPQGYFDQTLFGACRFDQAEENSTPLTPDQAPSYNIQVTCRLRKQTPGAFRVKVPWDIPGFTDRFDEAGDHPRSQIRNIINRVKAAGIAFDITYTKTWREDQDLQTQLTVVRSPLRDLHDIQIQLTVVPVSMEIHDVQTQLTVVPASREMHDTQTQLTIAPISRESHEQIEANLDISSIHIPESEELHHELEDQLISSGIFDYTEFDSGNGFT